MRHDSLTLMIKFNWTRIIFATVLSPAWSLQDSVGEVNKLQVHRCTFGKMGEALRLCDLVLNLLQVGWSVLSLCRLASPIAYYGILHWDAHRVKFQRLIVHLLPVNLLEVKNIERVLKNIVILPQSIWTVYTLISIPLTFSWYLFCFFFIPYLDNVLRLQDMNECDVGHMMQWNCFGIFEGINKFQNMVFFFRFIFLMKCQHF